MMIILLEYQAKRFMAITIYINVKGVFMYSKNTAGHFSQTWFEEKRDDWYFQMGCDE